MTDEAVNPTAQDEQLYKHVWNRRAGLIYRIRLSALYHGKRERFFDRVDKGMSMFTAVAATGAVMAVVNQVKWFDAAISMLTAAFSLVPLIFNPAQRAREHGMKSIEFKQLLSKALGLGEYWEAKHCDEILAEIVLLEASERAPLSALVADCQNQLNIASGDKTDLVKLAWHHQLFKNWWDFDATELEKLRNKPDTDPVKGSTAHA